MAEDVARVPEGGRAVHLERRNAEGTRGDAAPDAHHARGRLVLFGDRENARGDGRSRAQHQRIRREPASLALLGIA
jgi:hypothetical protein